MDNTTPSSQDLPSFKFDALNIHGEWKNFEQTFRTYLTSSGSMNKPEAFKIAILLNLMGSQALHVFNSFSFDQDVDLESVMKMFQDYSLQRKNIVEERYEFWCLTQQPEESVDAFVAKLRRKAETCRFRDQTDELIRDRLMQGCSDRTLVEVFLKEDDLTLDKVLQICQTAESMKATAEKTTNGESSLTIFTIDDGLNSNPQQVEIKQERLSDSFQEMPPLATSSPNDSLPLDNSLNGEAAKRGRGRPRIRPIATPQDDSVKRGRGRPRIHPVAQTPTDENGEPIKRSRGRPRIRPIGQEDDHSDDTPKRGRGRPRKYPRLDDFVNSI